MWREQSSQRATCVLDPLACKETGEDNNDYYSFTNWALINEEDRAETGMGRRHRCSLLPAKDSLLYCKASGLKSSCSNFKFFSHNSCLQKKWKWDEEEIYLYYKIFLRSGCCNILTAAGSSFEEGVFSAAPPTQLLFLYIDKFNQTEHGNNILL